MKRGYVDTIAAVLRVISQGDCRAGLARRMEIDHQTLDEHLNFLVRRKLAGVSPSGDDDCYQVTARGLEFLRDYEALSDLLEGGDQHDGSLV